MIKNFNSNPKPQHGAAASYDALVDTFISTEQSLRDLPELSAYEKVQLEQDIAISHLYHSSKIEGTNLNEQRLHKAIDA